MLNTKRLFDIPFYQFEKYPNANMFVTKKKGVWEGVSTKDFIDEIIAYSKGLIAFGIQPNDKVAIVSTNRVEWNIMDIAIQQIGAIVVPIYPNISANDYRYIFNDAEIKLCTVGSIDLFTKINEIRSEIPSLKNLFIFDDVENIPNWTQIKNNGINIDIQDLESRKKVTQNDDLATIIYTSGTTGNPKGVMLSHNNLLSNVEGCIPRIPTDNTSRVLTFLPACHVYERMLHYLYMYLGCSIYYAESMDTIGENIKEVKPNMFSAVPRLIEKVFEKIMAKGDELTGIKRKLFFWAIKLGEEYEAEGKSAWYKLKLWVARKIIFSKWKEALGGQVKAIASGSAALAPRLARLFLAAGIPILEGYGLTETSPVISVNCFKKGIKIGTVGTLLNNVQVKFGEDGEILVKGPNVMLGYYKLPDKTKEDIEPDGWFHTGDIGEMVDGKYLKITDRKKEIFKTSGGKYIAPQAMENKFKESRFIEQIIVIGENEKFPSGLIVPNFAFIKDYAKKENLNIGDSSNKSIIESPDIQSIIKNEVESFNKLFGNWEQLKRYELLDKEFSIEGGELTPTLKFKRKFILNKYKTLYDKIYCD
ncbi:MAG: long-chain fatty acid--CoA ligase [Flavobacteriia bacterium]|nr:long-chain fatty acid--CoA ligase [Flavobacteriia bacterium]